MNFYAIRAIYLHEMDRMRRTLFQSILSPVISTSLYFIVFGSVIGGMIPQIDGVTYGSFIVPGLLMLTLLLYKNPQVFSNLLPFFIHILLPTPYGASMNSAGVHFKIFDS